MPKAAQHRKGFRLPWTLFRSGFHRKASGGLATFPGLPHGGVGTLQIYPEKIGVEQGRGQAIVCQPLLESFERIRVHSQMDRQLFIIGQSSLSPAPACRSRKAGWPRPGRENCAPAGEQRQSGPQGIAGGGVGVIGQGIQKQIGLLQPRQMPVERQSTARTPGGPAPRHAVRLPARRFCRKGGLAFQQPQHAAINLPQNAHPAGENCRRQLVALVEIAEHKTVAPAGRTRRGGHARPRLPAYESLT